jgi:hypothetical protein
VEEQAALDEAAQDRIDGLVTIGSPRGVGITVGHAVCCLWFVAGRLPR